MSTEFPATYIVGSATGLVARTLLDELGDLPVSVKRFGVKGDGVTDDTVALQVALNSGLTLFFPPGVYLYSNALTATGSIVGAGWNSILQCTTSQGQNAAIYWTNVSSFKIQNLQFFPKNATAFYPDENAAGVKLVGCSQFEVSGCKFDNIANAVVLMSGCRNGKVFGNTLVDVWHDGIHTTAASVDITITNNEVINGGDDAFAVVGYQSDGVRPRRITISNNRVTGTKYSRGIVVVGGQEVLVSNNEIFNSQGAGIYVASESSYMTFGSDHVKILGNILDTCGISSNIAAFPDHPNGPFGMPAICLESIKGFDNSNIDIIGNTIKNSASSAIEMVNGGGMNNNIQIVDNDIVNAWDPNNKNGFSLTTISAATSSPTLSFNNNPGVAVGMVAWYFNGTSSVSIGVVVSATASTVTLNQNATVPSGGTVIFAGVGLFGATVATTTAAASGATSLTFATTTGVSYKDNSGFGSPGDEKTGISIGQTVSGTNIAAGTFVIGVTATTVKLSKGTTGTVASGASITFTPMTCMATQAIATSAASAAGSNTLTFTPYPSARGCAVGQGVSGTNIPVGTYVTAVAGNGSGPTVTLSNNVTGSGVASGASITFTGTGGLSGGLGISLFSTRNGAVSRNRLSGISWCGIYVDASCANFIDISDNVGENMGCNNAAGRLATIDVLAAGTILKLRGNYLAQPLNYPRAFDCFIYSPAGNWPYTSWGEDNYVQNGFTSFNVGQTPAALTVGASPWTFKNSNLSAVSMSIAGGTVSAITVSRNGQTAYATGLTSGMIDLKSGDSMTIVYSATPIVTMIPRTGQ